MHGRLYGKVYHPLHSNYLVVVQNTNFKCLRKLHTHKKQLILRTVLEQ